MKLVHRCLWNALMALLAVLAVLLWAPRAGDANGWQPHIVQSVVQWTPQVSGVSDDLYGVFFLDALRGWAVGVHNTILGTSDSGVTWRRLTDYQEHGPSFTTVRFVSPQEGWVSGLESLLHTVDGGLSWQPAAKLPIGAPNYGAGTAVGSSWFQLTAPGYSLAVYRTDDGGQSWVSLGRLPQVPNQDRRSVTFLDAQHGWIVYSSVQGQGGIATTNDGGQTWNVVPGSISSEPRLQFVDPSTGWALGPDGSTILSSVDGGQSWSALATGLRTSQRVMDLAFLDQSAGYALVDSDHGFVIATGDGGQTWQQAGQLQAPGTPRALSFVDSGHGWVVGDKGYIGQLSTAGSRLVASPSG